MAKNKEDIKYATAQAKVSEDDGLRVRYKAGTPLEGGKIADSQPVDLFSGATRISSSMANQQPPGPTATVAESQPVDLFSGAHNISSADHQHRTPPQGPNLGGGGGNVAPTA